MHILDDLEKIKKLDKSNLLSSIQLLNLQLRQTNEDLEFMQIPSSYKNVKNILVNGMGGSRLGARVAERLFEDSLSLPLKAMGGYKLPKFVNEKTLLILSSYSGNTEEIITSYEDAVKYKAKIMIFAKTGKLAEIALQNKLPGYYNFEPKFNPSNQPRMSLGYQVLGMMLLLAKCNLINISKEEINQLILFLASVKNKYDVNIPFAQNLTKKIAHNFYNRIPLFIGAEFLMGALHVCRNQLNENAKQLGSYYEIPELNHHLMEGLRFPKTNPKNLFILFVESSLYSTHNQQRISITKKVIEKYKIPYTTINLKGTTKLQQIFEIIQIGSFIVFYLSMLNNLDPTPIPWVDYFKEELKK